MNNQVVLATIDVTLYSSLNDLYEDLLALKKEVFADNERIVIRYSKPTALSLITKLIDAIDIPEYFIQFEQIDSQTGIDFAFSNSHCIYPWINLEIDNLGEIKPCCVYKESVANINTSSLKDAYVSNKLLILRQQFRNGEYPEGCSTCWKNEAANAISMRQAALHKFQDDFYRLDYQIDNFCNLKIFDLKLSNDCNLGCKICNSAASSTIARQELANDVITNIQFYELKKATDWAKSDIFWNQLLDNVQNLKYLDLYGGEPLMNKLHFKFLKKLIDIGVANQIKLDYNSNGTIFSEKFFDLWQHFKKVKISFSIDDFGDRFEAQRCGAVWVDVCNNLTKFNNHRSDKFITEVYPTINSQNVFWIPELLDWFYTQKFDHINFNILYYPSEYCIQYMPADDKRRTIEKLAKASGHPIFQVIIDMLELPKTIDNHLTINDSWGGR